MTITTNIVDIGHGLDQNGNLGVLNFAVLATADSGETARYEVSQIGGSYPPPATPRTPIMEPVMAPVMEPIMEPIMEDVTEPVMGMVLGEDGELHEQVIGTKVVGQRQVGERQVGERQIGEQQVGEQIVGYQGGYTKEELLVIADSVATARDAYAQAQSRLETMLLKPLVFVPPPVHVPTDAETKQAWADAIDSRVAFVYQRYTRFQVEYEGREAAALAFKTAGYVGDPTSKVTRFADNTGMTYQAATDLILAQAANLRSAVDALGNLRMDKYKVTRAATLAEAQAALDAIMLAVDAIDRSLA